MRVDHLAHYDIPPTLIERWKTSIGPDLLPLQEEVVRRYDLFGNRNLLVQAPTSSGKTFVGEMAAVQTALRQKQVVYLVPLKALAEEKYHAFQARYESYGLKVILSTRDHRTHDRDLEQGDFSLAVVVYEKLAQLLVRRPERVAEIDLVIADELEILGDCERGAGVELLLTQLLRAKSRVIGLSAVIGGAERLAEWLDAELVQSDHRPVELRFGVLHEGVFTYRTSHGPGRHAEVLCDGGTESAEEAALLNLVAFAERGERSLVFVRAKHDTRRGADRIAAHMDLPPATTALEALQALEPSRSRDELCAVLAHGVAFHNADLSASERLIVEEAFRQGEVMVLVSTSTLAVGLNLPARNVFLTTEKWRYDPQLGMPWKTPVSHMEYENMGGRAGRLGLGAEFGRAILVASSPFESELCWRRYVEGSREEIVPQLERSALEDPVLRLLASGHCRSLDDLIAFLERTLTGQWVWATECPVEELGSRVRAALHRCVEGGLIAAMPRGTDRPVQVTRLGTAVASKGIDMETAGLLRAWLEVSRDRDWCLADLLYAVLSTPEGRAPHVLLTTREYDEAGYVAELQDRTRHARLDVDVPLAQLRAARLQPFFESVRATKVTLFLLDWLENVPVNTIESRYNTMQGQILAAAAQVSWLIDAMGAMALAEGDEGAFTDRLARLARRLPLGVAEEGVALLEDGDLALNRRDIGELAAREWCSVDRLQGLPVAALAQCLDEAKAQRLHRWAQQHGEPPSVPASRSNSPHGQLIIDEARPNEIALDETVVPLQRKQYELIRLLAQAPGECVRYETIYNALWKGVCVEQSQMHYQKRTLLQRIREACPGREVGLIKTRSRYGYALTLAPESVVVRPAPSLPTG